MNISTLTSKELSIQIEEFFDSLPGIFQTLLDEYQQLDSVFEDYLYSVNDDYFEVFSQSGREYVGSFITNNDFICIFFKRTYTELVDVYFPLEIFNGNVIENVRKTLHEQTKTKKQTYDYIEEQNRTARYQNYLKLKSEFDESNTK